MLFVNASVFKRWPSKQKRTPQMPGLHTFLVDVLKHIQKLTSSAFSHLLLCLSSVPGHIISWPHFSQRRLSLTYSPLLTPSLHSLSNTTPGALPDFRLMPVWVEEREVSLLGSLAVIGQACYARALDGADSGIDFTVSCASSLDNISGGKLVSQCDLRHDRVLITLIDTLNGCQCWGEVDRSALTNGLLKKLKLYWRQWSVTLSDIFSLCQRVQL